MGFLSRLFGPRKSEGSKQGDQYGHYLYARCGRCGAPVRARIDLRNDLSPDDDGKSMVVRKMLIDERCFRPIETVARFTRSRQLIEQTIEGGEFIDEQTFESLKNPQE